LDEQVFNEFIVVAKSVISRAEQAEETKKKLLESALVLFSEQGYSKSSIRGLARMAGLSDGILYHHFPKGKQEILAVLLTQGVQQAMAHLNSMNQNLSQAPLNVVLDALCEMCVQLFSQHRALLKIILRESESMQLSEIHVISQLFEGRQQWLAALLEQRSQQGQIRQMDFMLAAQQFMAMNIQYGMTGLLNLNIGCDIADAEQRQRMIDHTLKLWQIAI